MKPCSLSTSFQQAIGLAGGERPVWRVAGVNDSA